MENLERLLIIDDETAILEVYSSFFKKRGYIVDTATNGIDGIELLKHNKYNVAIIDISMPKMDGIAVSKHIKDNFSNTDTIIITGHGEKEDAINAINVGVSAWFEKHGLRLETLHDKIKELINNYSVENIGKILSSINFGETDDK